MKKTFYTKDGTIERELTAQEINEFARLGDTDAKTETGKTDFSQAGDLQGKINVIARLLGLM